MSFRTASVGQPRGTALLACVAAVGALAGGWVASARAQAPDTTPPDTTITAGPADGAVIDTDAPGFSWISSEPNSTFACTVDGEAVPSCEQAFASGASPGPHTFSIAAIDPAGNRDPTPATRSFTVKLSGGSPDLGACPLDGNVIVATAGADTRAGTAGTDVMFGLGGDDVLYGLAGRDCLAGAGGDDRLLGGSGGDFAFGGAGDDRIAGQSGDDALYGEAGNDRIAGGPGNDILDGGHGSDRLTDSSGRDTFSGGPGNDRIDARDATRAGRLIPDRVSCGSGRYDVALVDRADRVATDCERVLRR
ncbi:MAG TPA: calcium-binding protein [Solirubrobacteraceae bacterium]|jgi:Ca2+-binding RTX toxin-like protein